MNSICRSSNISVLLCYIEVAVHNAVAVQFMVKGLGVRS